MEAGDRLPSPESVARLTNWLMIEENHDCSSGCKETRAAMSESKTHGRPWGTDDCVEMGSDVVVAGDGWVEMVGDASSMLCIAR